MPPGKFTNGVIDSNGNFATSVKFATGINDTSGTGGKFPPVSLIPVANLSPVVDTGGKFAAGVVDNSGAPCSGKDEP